MTAEPTQMHAEAQRGRRAVGPQFFAHARERQQAMSVSAGFRWYDQAAEAGGQQCPHALFRPLRLEIHFFGHGSEYIDADAPVRVRLILARRGSMSPWTGSTPVRHARLRHAA